MPNPTTRTTLILLLILAAAGIVGQLDYEDELNIEQANAKRTEVAKR